LKRVRLLLRPLEATRLILVMESTKIVSYLSIAFGIAEHLAPPRHSAAWL
jgi:hypothetical protein